MIWRLIPLIFGVVVLAIYLGFQSLSLNMMNWSLDQTEAYSQVAPSNSGLLANSGAGKSLTISEQALDISGELAFSPDHFVRNRIVIVERHLSMADLLSEGEDPPEKDLEELYVKARTPMTVSQYCQEVIASLATECVVADAGSRRLGRDIDLYHVQGALRYLPAYDMGSPSDQGGEIVEATQNLTPEDQPRDTSAARLAYFDKALAICAALKQRFGNCFVARVMLKLRTENGSRLIATVVEGERDDLFLHADARFAVHGGWGRVNQQTLDAALAEIVKSRP